MGKMKAIAIEMEEKMNEDNQISEEAIQAAHQEEYYWHLLHEFVAINKFFGQTKVMGDLKLIRDRLKAEEDKNKPRIQLL